MLHDTIKIEDYELFYKNYKTISFEGSGKRLLLKLSREEDLPKFLNDIAKAYKKAQRQYEDWRKKVWFPLLEEIQSLAVDDKVLLHAKPTHDYTGDQNKWWLYKYSNSPKPYGWGYSFDWVDEEPKEKLNYELGQKLYELDRYQEKFNTRVWVLKELLKKYLLKYIYDLYDLEWVTGHCYSNKLAKFNLQGDEYWYRIEFSRYGVPVWKNFIWQSNNTEEINI